ncbi:MAG: hypothetical protein E7117_03720 [Bacteroidales bacterium]|nr:hypothetical protein [Bacteroidales bacterium]
MRKYITLLLSVVMLAALSFSAVSCKKAGKDLTGTTWVSVPHVEEEYGFSVVYTLTFITETTCSLSYVSTIYGETETDSLVATYTYVEPTITIMSEGWGVVTGTVSDNVMMVYNQEGDGFQFIRQ